MTSITRALAPMAAAAAAAVLALASPSFAQQAPAEAPAAAEAPAEATEQAAPAEGADQAAPAAEAPAGEAPAAAEAPAAEPAAEAAAAPEGAPASDISSKDLIIGTPVVASDGVQIGEINRVTSDADGKVSEIHVTAGGPAGLNAKVVSISAALITAVGKPVKVSISAADAKKLPILDGGNG